MDLALDERRVDRPADVVGLDQFQDPNFPGLVVDLDLGDGGRVRDRRMGVEVDGTCLGIECGEGFERSPGAGDQLALDPGGDGGDVVDADASGRAPP